MIRRHASTLRALLMLTDGAETCNPQLGCEAGSDPCPGQMCRESDDECVDCLADADCADDSYCNGMETCGADGT